MNSFLLNGRRAFRQSGTTNLSSWTFDLSRASYDGKQMSVAYPYEWVRYLPDGRLMLSSHRTYSKPFEIREFDETAAYYDPAKPWNIDCLKTGASVVSPNSAAYVDACFTWDGKRWFGIAQGTLTDNTSKRYFLQVNRETAWDIADTSPPQLHFSISVDKAAYLSTGQFSKWTLSESVVAMAVSGNGLYVYYLTRDSPYNLYMRRLDEPFEINSMRLTIAATVPLDSVRSGTYRAFQFSPDGYRLVVMSSGESSSSITCLVELTLSVAWDIGTAVVGSMYFPNGTSGSSVGYATTFCIDDQQRFMYIVYRYPSYHIRQYSLPTEA